MQMRFCEWRMLTYFRSSTYTQAWDRRSDRTYGQSNDDHYRSRFPPRVSRNCFGGYRHRSVPRKAFSPSRGSRAVLSSIGVCGSDGTRRHGGQRARIVPPDIGSTFNSLCLPVQPFLDFRFRVPCGKGYRRVMRQTERAPRRAKIMLWLLELARDRPLPLVP
jgi:hypothetical protein